MGLIDPAHAAARGGGAAEVVLSDDGCFAYVSVRTTGKFNESPAAAFNQLCMLRLDPATGLATRVGNVPSGGNMPWCHAWGAEGPSRLSQTA